MILITVHYIFFIYSDGVVSLNEYTAFMISRETENVRSASEVEEAFRAITDGGKQLFVTEAELYQVSKHVCLKILFIFKFSTTELFLPIYLIMKLSF